jgi:hypothetical protein
MQNLVDADLDCSNAARLLMRMQDDLMLFVRQQEVA